LSRRGYLSVNVEEGETIRVCPSCLSPLSWFEYRVPVKRAEPDGVQSTEEKARCPIHGWVDWWRILSRESGRILGFSTFLRGGRLHTKAVSRERVLEHAERALVPFHFSAAKSRRKAFGREKLKKLRNRFRGYLVEDSRQGRLF
jgi:hypothetical protein